MAKAPGYGYGPVPAADEEMQKPAAFRPPPDFGGGGDGQLLMLYRKKTTAAASSRIASLDAFRGLCVFLMILVDYGGHVFPSISHSAWNGIHLADFVMPFFLFIVGVSLALVYKKPPNRAEATRKAVLKAVKLFLAGILLQGGFLHGLNSLTYGVDIETIRVLGILQRISIGYIVGAMCQIWLSSRRKGEIGIIKSYYWHWVAAFAIIAVYARVSYGVYVPDWEFSLPGDHGHVYRVNCSVKGDVGPACNSAGMIDRYVLGIGHLYPKPVYKNLKVCNMLSGSNRVSDDAPSWCHAPFDPEGLLSSLTAAVTCIIGLQYGHVLAHTQDHKDRLENWSGFSVCFLLLGLILVLLGIPINKPLYSISYMLITSASAGITFAALYLLVDVYGQGWVTRPLEWLGKHSLTIFAVVSSNLAVIAIQGFYWKSPQNNIMNWIVSFFVQR